MQFTTRTATPQDLEELIKIRIEAMKPSLEAIGRFNPETARNRFIATFIPESTFVALKDNKIIGYYMLTETEEFQLNHLYVSPESQGLGLGKFFIEQIKSIANQKQKKIILEPLKNSPANDFYISQNFHKIDEIEFDNIYCWP